MKKRKRECLPKPEPIKHDPIEDTEEFRSIIEEVDREAESLMESDIRFCRYYYVEKEKNVY